jgi:hypothetical protein
LFLEDVCAEIIETNLPTGWFAYSNTSLYVPSGIFDGNYYIVYKLKINGVPQTGTGTSTIRVGNALLSGPSRNLNKKSITGRNVIDVSKTGVTASTVPSTGTNGAGYLYSMVTAAGLTEQEVSGEVVDTNLPTGWYAYSNSSLYVPPSTPDGNYYLRYLSKINGIPEPKLSTLNIHLGAAPAVTPMNRNMNQSFSGKRLLTTPKVGVLASLIPSTGTHGPAYAYNDLTFPADANKLVRGFILTLPSSGTMLADDDTSFTFSGAADGVYTFTYELRVDDVVLGTATGSITVGTLAGISIVLDPVIVNMSASSAAATSDATIAITLDNGSFSISANSGTSATISILLDNVINSVSATAGNQSSFDIVLDTVVASMSATSSVTSSASFNIILSNILTSVNAVSMPDSPEATIDIQLSNGSLYMTASGSEPPLSVGPNVQIPITLAVDIYGKLIIVF